MEGFDRYAIYHAPDAALADFGASWLGWDAEAGQTRRHPAIRGLPLQIEKITRTPRKYGFHATLKPPFRLADGRDIGELHDTLTAFARTTRAVRLEGLRPARLGPFVALVPEGDTDALRTFASRVVSDFDGFRAPATPAEVARRRAAGLTPRQETNLVAWGYPYVMDEFHFHMTLTGKLSEADAEAVLRVLTPHLEPRVARPYRIASISLFGEDAEGRFHHLHRYRLKG